METLRRQKHGVYCVYDSIGAVDISAHNRGAPDFYYSVARSYFQPGTLQGLHYRTLAQGGTHDSAGYYMNHQNLLQINACQ
mmetsp:Transcript_69961/g.154726  ORF Transcript_69961/g.154726 Transcript_69961/m.154726 type:complete len:81 (-) Transcript_69961:322-564(-)